MGKSVFVTKEFWLKFAVIGSTYIFAFLAAQNEWLALGAALFLLLLMEVVFPPLEKELILKIAALFYVFLFSSLLSGNWFLGSLIALAVYASYEFVSKHLHGKR